MDGIRTIAGFNAARRKAFHRCALAAGAALLLHTPAASAPAPMGETAAAQPAFAEQFAAFDAVPEEAITAAHAVDLDTIEPPADPVARVLGEGVASYYGKRFAGRPTASGERFDPAQYTAAHRTLPFGSKVRVTNPRTGQSVVVRINDRGPFVRGRMIDLSRAAAEEIGIVTRGHGTVELALLR